METAWGEEKLAVTLSHSHRHASGHASPGPEPTSLTGRDSRDVRCPDEWRDTRENCPEMTGTLLALLQSALHWLCSLAVQQKYLQIHVILYT